MSKPLHWRELVLPTVVAPAAMRAVLVGLAGLPGQPRLVMEATSDAGRLRHRLGADDDLALRRACHVVRTHVPDVVVLVAEADDEQSAAIQALFGATGTPTPAPAKPSSRPPARKG